MISLPDDILHNGIVPCIVAGREQGNVFQRVNRLHEFAADIHDDFVEFEQWPVLFLLRMRTRPGEGARKIVGKRNGKVQLARSCSQLWRDENGKHK